MNPRERIILCERIINDEQLTDEQIENWRKVLCGILGPYALIMTREQIQAFRDKMQKDFSQL
jgi:hypothetical protein